MQYLFFKQGLTETYPAGKDAAGTGWTWTGSTRTFTLHNANIEGTCSLPNGSTLVLEGDNFVSALTGEGYSIKGLGSLTADTISGNVVFRGSGEITVNDKIGNGYTNGWRIRIESGTITAPAINEGVYGTTKEIPDEIVITGGTVKLGCIVALKTDVTITGGTIYVDSNSGSVAACKIDGRYRDGNLLGGHFTFLGGTLSIDGKNRMALMTEIGFLTADLGCGSFASGSELLSALGDIPLLIQLGSGVSVTGGKLCTSIVADSYIPSVAGTERYAGFSFSEDGRPFSYRWGTPQRNFVKTLSLSGPAQKPNQDLLWEPTYESSKFTDLLSDSFYLDAVYWAVKNNITVGTSTTTFSPLQNCTEIQILTFLWRAAGKPIVDTTLPVTVTGVDDYISAAKWAYSKGMIDGTFEQDTPCTRATAVKFIWQASGSPAVSSDSGFTDVSTSADYARAVTWAVARGVTNGTGTTTFSPAETCSRAQIVTFLHRLMTNGSGHRYQYVVDDCSWTEAFSKAKAAGGYLARIDSLQEYAEILSGIHSQGLTNVQFRLGARRASDGRDYHWVDENNAMLEEVISSDGYWAYSEWLAGEPSYEWADHKEEFLSIYLDEGTNMWVWNDVADQVYQPGKGMYGYIIEFNS